MALNLKVAMPLYESKNDKQQFTPISDPVKQKLFYTPRASYKPDRASKRLSFLPMYKDRIKWKLKSDELARCESLARITLILVKYQKWIRKNKVHDVRWDDSDSEEDDDSDESDEDDEDEDEEDDGDEMDDEEAMQLALYQQHTYGNSSMVAKIRKKKVWHWINNELSKNYNQGRLLKDYLHLLNDHKTEYEEIHNHLCETLDQQIKPDDDFNETYYCYSHEDASNVEIEIEQLLDEIQLHFGGIFDSKFFHQKYKVVKQIGTGIEGEVYKIKLRQGYRSLKSIAALHDIVESQQPAHASNESKQDSSSEDDDDDDQKNKDDYFAAKMIEYNERTMNNYRVMGKFSILEDFEMYLDRAKDKLILVSELWDMDCFDYMQKHSKVFNEDELYYMVSQFIVPLLFRLHVNHYVHGDIKPNNFVVNVYGDNDNEYGLIDFGTMLKLNETTNIVRSGLIGSMGYHSPEIVFNLHDGPINIDTKCDIWPLALTMIYLLQGTHPLIADDFNLLGEKKVQLKIGKCLQQMQNTNKISSELRDLLQSMLQIDPIKRFNIYEMREHTWMTKNKTSTMRLLFLDIDGVLNQKKSRPKSLKPELMMKLKAILNATQCRIVLSTSWRRDPDLKKKFKKFFKRIIRLDYDRYVIGETPNNGKNPTRVHEIKEYFQRNKDKLGTPDECVWCVVDDMDLLNENGGAYKKECEQFIQDRWVRPDIKCGLSDENVDAIISILSR